MVLEFFMVSVDVIVCICSYGGACEILFAFWVELGREKFSLDVQRVEAGDGCC